MGKQLVGIQIFVPICACVSALKNNAKMLNIIFRETAGVWYSIVQL